MSFVAEFNSLPLDSLFQRCLATTTDVGARNLGKHTPDERSASIFPRALAVPTSSTSELMSDQRNVLLRDATQADPCGLAAVCHG